MVETNWMDMVRKKSDKQGEKQEHDKRHTNFLRGDGHTMAVDHRYHANGQACGVILMTSVEILTQNQEVHTTALIRFVSGQTTTIIA